MSTDLIFLHDPDLGREVCVVRDSEEHRELSRRLIQQAHAKVLGKREIDPWAQLADAATAHAAAVDRIRQDERLSDQAKAEDLAGLEQDLRAKVAAIDANAAATLSALEAAARPKPARLSGEAEARKAAATRRLELLAEVGTFAEFDAAVGELLAGDEAGLQAAEELAHLLARRRTQAAPLQARSAGEPSPRAQWGLLAETLPTRVSEARVARRTEAQQEAAARLERLNANLARCLVLRITEPALREVDRPGGKGLPWTPARIRKTN